MPGYDGGWCSVGGYRFVAVSSVEAACIGEIDTVERRNRQRRRFSPDVFPISHLAREVVSYAAVSGRARSRIITSHVGSSRAEKRRVLLLRCNMVEANSTRPEACEGRGNGWPAWVRIRVQTEGKRWGGARERRRRSCRRR